jgi:hypothetical protein
MNARGLGSTVLGALCAFVAMLGVAGGGLLVASAPALAAAPETPEVSVESVTAFTASFHGVLNPAAPAPSEGGTYKFLYKAGTKTECEGGSETSSRISTGQVHEESFETVTGLAANTEYAVCLSVTNLEGETRLSAAVPFKTTVPPEKPETKAASAITATSAKFEGVLNPHSAAKVGGHFAYSNPGGSSCLEGPTAGLEEFEGEKEEKAIAVHATVGLEPARTYRVCLVATDEMGEAVAGKQVLVKTLAPAPEVLAGAASYSTAAPFEATLHAEVNAEDQETTVYFQYSTSPALIGKSLATPTDVPAAPGDSIGAGLGDVGAEAATGDVLSAGALYYYQAVAINPTGATYGAVREFETLGVPTVQTGAAEEVTGSGAKLGGKLDAGGEAEYYVEYGTASCSASSCGAKSEAVRVSGKVQECTLGGVLQQCVAPIALSGLEPNTTYHYWLVANNSAAGKPVHGAAEEFTTEVAAPAPTTGLAEDVTPTSARITGELDPGGGETEYYVEYVSPPSAPAKSAVAFADGKAEVGVGPIAITGLQPDTTYYYWLAARSSAVSEPVHGEGHSFTTPKSEAELEAQEAAARGPAEEQAASRQAKQRLAEEEAKRATETAAANVARQEQYEEIAAQTVLIEREEAQAGAAEGTPHGGGQASGQGAKAGKAKPRRASCKGDGSRRGEKKNRCVHNKSKKKGKVKR